MNAVNVKNMINYTTIEQSKKLLELGLNPESADMFYCYGMKLDTKEWCYDSEPTVESKEFHRDICDLPCWSIGTLIDLMPKYMKSGKDYFDLMIIPFYPVVKYYNESTKTYMESKMGKTLMEAVIKMAERLLECKSTYLKDNPNKMI